MASPVTAQSVGAPRGRGITARLRRVLPWAIAAAILWYLFREVAVADAWSAVEQARVEVFVPLVLILVVFWFLLESRAFAYMFSRFNARVTWAEARSLRGASYLLTPINWNLGTASIILFLRQSKGIGALESTSSMLFYGTIDAMVMGSLTVAGVWMLPSSPEIDEIARFVAIFVGFQIVFLGMLMMRRLDWRWLRRLRSVPLFRTHGLATWRDLALLSGIRTLYFGGFVLFFWLGTRAFQVDLPLAFAMASTPIVLVVAAVPITPAGLGTQQAAMLYFYSTYGGEAAILAFGLAFPVALLLARVPLGLLYLGDLGALRRSEELDVKA